MNNGYAVKRALMAMELRYDDYHTGHENSVVIEFNKEQYTIFKDDEDSAKELIHLAMLSECISEKCLTCEHCAKCINEVKKRWEKDEQR